MNSFRNKIVLFFMLLSLVTIIIFEVFSMYTVKYYYYTSTYGILRNQIRYSTDLYSSYLTDYQIDDVVLQDKDQFYRNNSIQVQLLNNSGVVLFDNIGTAEIGTELVTTDVESAKVGNEGKFIGKAVYSKSRLMAISRPIKSRGEQVGILRFVTSLRDIDNKIYGTYFAFISFGILVLLLAFALAVVMARNIVKPIRKITNVASKLADGNFNIRADENDYDEIGKLAKTLNFMTDNIKEKEQLKNDFISSVSHELRTPLTSINGWATTLLYEPEDTELVTDGLGIIESECKRLSNMVEELLDFSRFTSGRITLEKTEVNITELAMGITKQLTPRAKSLGIDLIINYDKQSIFANVDNDRIKQVLINLLDNALKFTIKGGVVMTNITQDNSSVFIEVIDTGVGIASEEINLITGKFYKGSNSNSHAGLGLSICEEIIKLHKGDMLITSKINEGTTIQIILPKEDNYE